MPVFKYIRYGVKIWLWFCRKLRHGYPGVSLSYTVLHVPSRLDHQSLDQAREIFEEGLASESSLLILNFDQCDFMDSSGLGMLVHTAVSPSKEVRLVEVKPRLRNILRLTQVDRILRVFSTLDNALASA